MLANATATTVRPAPMRTGVRGVGRTATTPLARVRVEDAQTTRSSAAPRLLDHWKAVR